LDGVSILQLGAGDGHALVIGDGGTLGKGDSQAVDGELGLGGDAFVQVCGAALDVDFGLLGQASDWLACDVVLGDAYSASSGCVVSLTSWLHLEGDWFRSHA
jgi:hypothetical protein